MHPVDRSLIEWGSNVQARRLAAELSLYKLAVAVGVTPQHIHKIEKGETRASDRLRWEIARELKVEVAELFPAPSTSEPVEAAS